MPKATGKGVSLGRVHVYPERDTGIDVGHMWQTKTQEDVSKRISVLTLVCAGRLLSDTGTKIDEFV